MRAFFEKNTVQERRRVAGAFTSTRRMLMELAVDPDYLVRKLVAQNPQAPPEALVLLYGGERDAISAIAFSAGSPDFDPNRVLRLSSEEDLLCIAAHGNAGAGTLARLAEHDAMAVRLAALRNANVSQATLEKAAHNRQPRLRQTIAELPFLSPEIGMRLAKDDDAAVRMAVARNPQLAGAALDELAQDPDIRVRGQVALSPLLNLDTLSRLCRDAASYVRVCAASNSSARGDMLDALAKDPEGQTRLRVAEHPRTPTAALDILSSDADDDVRLAVAAHPNTGIAALKLLAYDEVTSVQSAVFSRGECPLFGDQAVRVLSRFGVDPNLLFESSPRRFCAGVIGSKHPSEVEFLFNDTSMESLTGLSSLQSVFVKRNSNGRIVSVDRHRYLQFLAAMNARSTRSGAFAIDAQSLRAVFDVLNHDEVLTVAAQQRPGMSRDTFRMLADVTAQKSEQEKGAAAAQSVRAWLTEHGDYGAQLHNYLSNRSTRELSEAGSSAVFLPQARLASGIDAINAALRDRGFELKLPRTAGDLLKLGRLMRHCCGSRYYIDACHDGRSLVFHLQPPEQPRRGVTFQFDHRGHLVQAKGFANCDPDQAITGLGKTVYLQLMAA
ncbi:MAG: hypothetical protein ACI87W_002676 [Halieaceae bacterium]|jgi:hypothetical protein